MSIKPLHTDLQSELEELRQQLQEAYETIDAIRTGQVDALVVEGESGPQLYTLKSADQTYRVFIEKMTEGAVTLSPDGRVLYSNSQFATMVNLPLSQVTGLPFEQFVAEENRSLYRELFGKCWTVDCREEILINGGDHRTPVQLSLTSLQLDEKAALSIIVTDLTVQKDIENQLRKKNEQLLYTNKALESSNHDLQQFASVASHDLQEPLRKVQMFAHLLNDKEELTDESRRFLNKIIASSTRMKTLIIDILNYSRLSADDLFLEYVDLNELIRELTDDFELIIQDKNAVIRSSNLPVIMANRGQIRQVFQNIISNALKFGKPRQTTLITVSASIISEKSFDSPEDTHGGYCRLSIEDNGIGFNEKFVDNIFYLFERLNSKDAYEGTGIGLAIAKKIIDKHQGLITARSEVDKGSTFLIILPLRQALPAGQ